VQSSKLREPSSNELAAATHKKFFPSNVLINQTNHDQNSIPSFVSNTNLTRSQAPLLYTYLITSTDFSPFTGAEAKVDSSPHKRAALADFTRTPRAPRKQLISNQ
jgi:hypothetical protein